MMGPARHRSEEMCFSWTRILDALAIAGFKLLRVVRIATLLKRERAAVTVLKKNSDNLETTLFFQVMLSSLHLVAKS